MSSVKKDNINKHFHSLPNCCAPRGLETCARWAGPAALRNRAGELEGYGLLKSSPFHLRRGGAPDFMGDHAEKKEKKRKKKKTTTKKPQKTKTSNENPHNPTI